MYTRFENKKLTKVFVNGKQLKDSDFSNHESIVYINDAVKMKKRNNKVVFHYVLDKIKG